MESVNVVTWILWFFTSIRALRFYIHYTLYEEIQLNALTLLILRRKVWVVLIIGTIEMVLGVFVAVIPAYDITVFNIIIAVVLLMVGFMYLLAEFTGKKYKSSMPSEMTKET